MHVRNQEKVIILSYSWLKEAVLEEAGKGRGEEKEEDKNVPQKTDSVAPLSTQVTTTHEKASEETYTHGSIIWTTNFHYFRGLPYMTSAKFSDFF